MIALTNNIFRGSKKRGLVIMRDKLRIICCCGIVTCLVLSLLLVNSFADTPSVTIKLSECDEGLKIVTTTSNETVFNGQSAAWFGYIELPEGCTTLGEEEIYEYDSPSYYWCIEKQDDKYFVEADYGINDFEFVLPLGGEVIGNVKLQITDIRVNGQRNITCNEDSILSLILGSSSGGDNIAIPDSSIANFTGSAAATVTGTVDNGKATLNVACDKACVVAYTTDDGATYNRVSAVQADSGYNFVVPDYSENMKFVVGLSGDADGDGSVGTSDYTAIARSLLLPENGRYQALSTVNSVFADADGDGTVGTSDYTAIARSLLLESNARYAAIEWK